MGQKAKIVNILIVVWLAIVVMVAIVGCDEKETPPPTIVVTEEDSSDWTTVVVTFHNHNRSSNRPIYTRLNNPQELEDYKNQVEFLLSRLEETERRMNVHEPEVEYGTAP